MGMEEEREKEGGVFWEVKKWGAFGRNVGVGDKY